jgi:hypothetical protein
MALSGVSHPKQEVAGPGRLAAWSGVISWALYGLLAVLAVAVVAVFVRGHAESKHEDRRRAAWDEVFLAAKDKKRTPEDQIPALEGVWDKVSGTPVQTYLAFELAHWHLVLANDDEREKGQRRQALKKACALYDLARKEGSKNLLYGPLAAAGAGLCREQEGDYDGAIEVLKDGTEKYGKTFLYEKLCYDLGRNCWLRSLKREKDGKANEAADDRRAALDSLGRAVKDPATERSAWRQEALFLRSLLEKPGPALKIFPDGKVPPPKEETKKAEAKAEPKAEAKAEPKAEAKAEPKAEAKAEPKTEAKAEPKTEPKAEAAKVEPKKDSSKKEEPKAGPDVKK